MSDIDNDMMISRSCLEVKSRSCRTKLTTRDGQIEIHNLFKKSEFFGQFSFLPTNFFHKVNFCPGQFVVTWNEEHNHASNEEGFKQRKAKTDLINAIFTSGLMNHDANFYLTNPTREEENWCLLHENLRPWMCVLYSPEGVYQEILSLYNPQGAYSRYNPQGAGNV